MELHPSDGKQDSFNAIALPTITNCIVKTFKLNFLFRGNEYFIENSIILTANKIKYLQ